MATSQRASGTGFGSSADRGATSLVSPVRAYAPIAVACAALAVVPVFVSDSRSMMGVVTGGLLFACYAVAFNVIFGSTGQLFLCVGALAGIGGFGSVILSQQLGWPWPVGIIGGAVAASVVGALLSWVAVSRSLDVIFTGIVTLAFSLSFENLVLGLRDLTGGESGLRVTEAKETLLGEDVPAYYILLAVLALYLVIYRRIQRSMMGWAFRALRDDEVAAELAGIDVARFRVYAGVVGSAMLGLVGGLYAHAEGFIGPSTYAFGHVDVRTLVMLAFGGIGSLLGPVLGAVAFTVLDEVLVNYSQLRLMLYGVIILGLFLGFRRGVIPSVQGLQRFGRSGR